MNLSLNDVLPRLCGIIGLLGLNALLVACEFSLIRLRYSHFSPDLLERLKRQRGLAGMIEHADITSRVARLGMVSCTICYGLLLYPFLQEIFGHLELTVLGASTFLSIVLALLLAIGIHFLVGELVPRGLALHYPIQALRSSSLVVKAFYYLTLPFLRVLSYFSRWLLHLLGVAEDTDLGQLDIERQLETLGADRPALAGVSYQIIKNTFQIRSLVVQDVILPRNQLLYMELSNSVEENLALARSAGHTRFPLCQDGLDNCLGLIHIKDLFCAGPIPVDIDLQSMMREIIRVDPGDPLEDTLQKLRRFRAHMALVVDEFGGTVGAITLERILEEFVGQIQDEFDAEEALIKETRPNLFRVSGLTPIHDLEESLSLSIVNEDVSTFSGLITSELGRIPEKNESFTLEGMEIAIAEVDDTRVISALVKLVEPLAQELPSDG